MMAETGSLPILYSALGPRQIRVLDLAPGNLNDALHATLRTINLDACTEEPFAEHGGYYNWTPAQHIRSDGNTRTSHGQAQWKGEASAANPAAKFEAVSYEWGPAFFDEDICMEGALHVQITSSLFGALRRLRLQHATRTLWADAICIDQSNAHERSAQVAMMGEIYRRCSSVLIWLGEERLELCGQRCVFGWYTFIFAAINRLELLCQDPTPNSPHADLIHRLSAEMIAKPVCICCSRQCDILDRETTIDVARRITHQTALLATYGWFTRMWVVQEIALGVKAHLYCGSHNAPWRAFTELLGCTQSPILQTDEAIAAIADNVRQDVTAITSYSKKYEHGQFTPDELLTSLVKFRTRQCRFKHDRVYATRALLGLESAKLLIPDYQAEYFQVYRETVLLCLTRMKNSGRQVPHCALVLAMAGVQETDKDAEKSQGVTQASSWVPDFSRSNEHTARKLAAYSWHSSFQFKESCDHDLAFYCRPPEARRLGVRAFRFAGISDMFFQNTPDPQLQRAFGIDDVSIASSMHDWAQKCREYFMTTLGSISSEELHRATCHILTRGNHPTGGTKIVRRGRERVIEADGVEGDDESRLRYALRPFFDPPERQRFDFTSFLAKITIYSSEPEVTILSKIAWVPRVSLLNDEICFIRGAPFAFVVRRLASGDYRLLGDAWIYELDEGRLYAGAMEAGDQWIEFE